MLSSRSWTMDGASLGDGQIKTRFLPTMFHGSLVGMQEDVGMSIDKSWHGDLPAKVDVTSVHIDVTVIFSVVDVDDAASYRVNDD